MSTTTFNVTAAEGSSQQNVVYNNGDNLISDGHYFVYPVDNNVLYEFIKIKKLYHSKMIFYYMDK